MPKELKLKNLNVVFFESRLAKTMADLIKLQGGSPFSAPSMKEVPLEYNPTVFSFAEKLFNEEVDVLIFLTGVGARALMAVLETRYPREKVLSALKRISVVPRGPKPIRVLSEWGVPYAFAVPEPNTWKEILSSLDQQIGNVPIKDRRVFVQEYGTENPELLEGLKTRGAHVTRLPVYRWELPDDLEPLKKSIRDILDGKMQVAVFTTAVQIDHALKVARFLDVERPLKSALGKMVIASVGPDCTKSLNANGILVDIQPESPKMGPLIAETAEKAHLILKNKMSSSKVFVGDQIDRHSEERSDEESHHNEILRYAQDDKLQQSVFMKACRLEKVPYTPVWLMRQAGRYMKEYRAIRDNTSFLDVCKDKDLVTEITVVAQEKLRTDAAILFSDILLLVEAFGLGLDYLKGGGPSIEHPVRCSKDIEELHEIRPKDSLAFVFDAVRQVRQALDPKIPLIGFAGAPFTLASYMVEGGASKDFKETKKLMSADESLWKVLMEKIVKATVLYLNAQIEAGAQVVQVFDSWAGNLSEAEYIKYALPYSKKLIQGLDSAAPVIHFGTGTGSFIEKFSEAGGSVIGVDHRIPLSEAWQRIGYQKAVQGNLDPQILCTDIENIRKHVKVILDSVKGRPGHIFNLGHGVLPDTPVVNAIALVEIVHELSGTG